MLSISIFLLIALSSVACSQTFARQSRAIASKYRNQKKNIICYYGSWAVYRQGNGRVTPRDLNPFACTHLIYAFATITDNDLAPMDPHADINLGGYKNFVALKKINPAIKLILSVGGFNAGPEIFTGVVQSDSTLKAFARNVVMYLRSYGFDGLDIDWEFPGAENRNQFTNLIRTVKSAFSKERRSDGVEPLLLSTAVSAFEPQMNSYNGRALALYLDFINIMTYNYHGFWENIANHHSPLLPSPIDTDMTLNVAWSVNKWLSMGVPAYKLNLGFPLYGRSFTLQNKQQTKLGSPVTGRGLTGPHTNENGIIAYFELCENLFTENWHIVRSRSQKVPYAYKDYDWIGFDDTKSFEDRAKYVIAKNLGGAFVWSIDMEDIRGSCNGETYPMIKSIRSVFDSNNVISLGEYHEVLPQPINSRLPEWHNSVDSDSATSGLSSNSITPDQFHCKNDGLFSHPTDCHKFIHCAIIGPGNIYPYEQKCPPKLVFDERENVCNYLEVTGCKTGRTNLKKTGRILSPEEPSYSSENSVQSKATEYNKSDDNLSWHEQTSEDNNNNVNVLMNSENKISQITTKLPRNTYWTSDVTSYPIKVKAQNLDYDSLPEEISVFPKDVTQISEYINSNSNNYPIQYDEIPSNLFPNDLASATDKRYYQQIYPRTNKSKYITTPTITGYLTDYYANIWNNYASSTTPSTPSLYVSPYYKTSTKLSNVTTSAKVLSPADIFQHISNPCFDKKIMPHPYVCFKYIKCVMNENGEAEMKEFECPPAHEFDNINLICVIPEKPTWCATEFRGTKRKYRKKTSMQKAYYLN